MKTMKTMKTMTQNYFLRAAAVMAIVFLASNQASAQTAVGSDVVKDTTNIVKVIDNKGTIKYFQSNNGITQITNTTANKTTTTWQLGGTLTDSTYIDTKGQKFGLKGLVMTTLKASTDGALTSKGYTLLVSDDATGKVERVLASALIEGGVKEIAIDQATETAAADYTIDAKDLPELTTVANKISIFRNGIKLRKGDYSLAAGAITIKVATVPLYLADVLEIQWVK